MKISNWFFVKNDSVQLKKIKFVETEKLTVNYYAVGNIKKNQ